MLRLESLRIERNIDQKVLSLDLRVSQPTISDWENGKKTPSVKNLIKLAAYFGVSIDYLLGLTENKSTPEDKGGPVDPLRSTLLHNFDQLNQEGRERLVETSDDMVSSGKYIKSDPAGLGKEA